MIADTDAEGAHTVMGLVTPKVSQQRLRGGLALHRSLQNVQRGLEVINVSAVQGEELGRANAPVQRRAAFNSIPYRSSACAEVLAVPAEPLGGALLLVVLFLRLLVCCRWCLQQQSPSSSQCRSSVSGTFGDAACNTDAHVRVSTRVKASLAADMYTSSQSKRGLHCSHSLSQLRPQQHVQSRVQRLDGSVYVCNALLGCTPKAIAREARVVGLGQ